VRSFTVTILAVVGGDLRLSGENRAESFGI